MILAKQKHISKKHRGFTLLEVTIVIGIIGALSALTFPLLRSTAKAEKEVEVAARDVVALLREAQNYALTGKQLDSNVPCSFGVEVTDVVTYKLLESVHSPGLDCSGSWTIYKGTYRLPNGVQFVNHPKTIFRVPFGEVMAGSATIVKLKKGSVTRVVCVGSGSGNIREAEGTICPAP